jgi:hypothetical protein
MFIERASGVLLGALFPPPIITLRVADVIGRFDYKEVILDRAALRQPCRLVAGHLATL